MDSPEIPRTVWLFWMQGWEQAPQVVKSCRDSWERENPTWRIVTLSGENFQTHAPWLAGESPDSGLAGFSDRLRIELLAEHGGVWADSTVFCVLPLDDWLPSAVRNGFFFFSRPVSGWPLASWFIAASPGNPIVVGWRARTRAYWSGRVAADNYFWFHRLFRDLVREDPAFSATWAHSGRISADGPHYFEPYGRRYTARMSRRAAARIASRRDPVYKLNHRTVLDVAHDSSAARYFANGAALQLPTRPGLARLDLITERVRQTLRHLSFRPMWTIRTMMRRIKKIGSVLIRSI